MTIREALNLIPGGNKSARSLQERNLHKEAMEAWALAYAAKTVREARRLGQLAIKADKAWDEEQARLGKEKRHAAL